MEGGEDLHLAILSYITTPLNHSLPSPAELLNSRKFRYLLPLQIRQKNHIQQYMKVMQHQKHEQVKHYDKSAKDLPTLKTGDAVYVQLVPNIRRWMPAVVFKRISARSYKVKTITGGIYIRNRKFIRVKYSDLRQSLQTTRKNIALDHSNTHTRKPKRITRRSERLIESMNFIRTWDT